MKLLLLTCLIALASACADSDLPFMKQDCGYSGYFAVPKNGEQIQIRFSTVTAEILDGHRNCGFGYVPTRVTRATARGVELKEIAKEKGEFVYAVPPGFDPRKDTVSIDMFGTLYTSDPEKVKQVGDNVNFALKR